MLRLPSDMDQFLVFPETLLASCLERGQFIHLSAQVVSYIADIDQLTKLHQHEQLLCPDYLKQAKPSRLNEFFAGRIVAQAILKQHFSCTTALTSRSNKLPIWPQGLSGCISHTQNKLLVMVSAQYLSVGADLQEQIQPEMAKQISSLILTSAEQQLWHHFKTELDFSEYLSLIFSLKESLYKAVFPVVNSYIDFLELCLVDIDLTRRIAQFEFCSKIQKNYPVLKRYSAQWQRYDEYVISFALV
ncbi:4'-phosphopantetheinyl transferase family protein [Acinetobacter rudis]|uniref:4'-phosphopantetheinyl transferase family protein n=1 Tax=Acinetobacter rudis TaxID=632955 RepID=UPI003340833F